MFPRADGALGVKVFLDWDTSRCLLTGWRCGNVGTGAKQGFVTPRVRATEARARRWSFVDPDGGGPGLIQLEDASEECCCGGVLVRGGKETNEFVSGEWGGWKYLCSDKTCESAEEKMVEADDWECDTGTVELDWM